MTEHKQPELPYEKSALEPQISSETIDYHYGKHHATYIAKLNKLLPGSEFEDATLEEIIRDSSGAIFNNAAQAWNHSFYWNCLSPDGGGEPPAKLAEAIDKSFGSVSEMEKKFTESAVGNFGSGWTWLVVNKQGELEILNTSNADTPLRQGYQPLLTCDVWEHAYYIDYRNSRPDYLQAFWELVNWEFAMKNFTAKPGTKAANELEEMLEPTA